MPLSGLNVPGASVAAYWIGIEHATAARIAQ